MAEQITKKAKKQADFDGLEIAESIYGDRPKKRKQKVVEDAKVRPNRNWSQRKKL